MAAKKASGAERLLERAGALAKSELVQLSFDPLEAKRACRSGLEAIAEHRRALKKDFPGFELDELDQLPELCDLVLIAQREVQTLRKAGGDIADLVIETLGWRRKLMGLAQSLAEKGGVIDPRAVRRIEAGKGTTDNVQDVADLAKLLEPVQKAVEALHGVGALEQAASAAQAALSALGGTGAETPASRKAADRRDRLTTLVIRGHDRLRSAAAAVLGYRQAVVAIPPLAGGSGPTRSVQEAPPTPSQPEVDG